MTGASEDLACQLTGNWQTRDLLFLENGANPQASFPAASCRRREVSSSSKDHADQSEFSTTVEEWTGLRSQQPGQLTESGLRGQLLSRLSWTLYLRMTACLNT